MHVCAGRDPVTGKKRRLRRMVKTETRAAQELAKLLASAETGRAPDEAATVGLALDKYLEVADLGVSTWVTHESYIQRIIRRVLDDVKLRRSSAGTLDALLRTSAAVLAALWQSGSRTARAFYQSPGRRSAQPSRRGWHCLGRRLRRKIRYDVAPA